MNPASESPNDWPGCELSIWLLAHAFFCTQLANFFAGDTSSTGGIRIAVKDLDGDAQADVVVGAGTKAGSRVTAYAGKSIPIEGPPPELFHFDAFPGFGGGVFVG